MRATFFVPALLLAVLLLVFPFMLKALTAEELQAEIQSLLAEVATLQAQLKILTPAPPPASVFTPTPAYPQSLTYPQSPAWCPLALPPATMCSAGWKPITDQYGCTSYYQCSILLPKFASTKEVSLKVVPESGEAPLRVTFTLSATDSTLRSGIQYTIDFDDGDEKKFPRKKKPSLSHTYDEDGEYEVSVTREARCSASRCSGESTEVVSTTITVE